MCQDVGWSVSLASRLVSFLHDILTWTSTTACLLQVFKLPVTQTVMTLRRSSQQEKGRSMPRAECEVPDITKRNVQQKIDRQEDVRVQRHTWIPCTFFVIQTQEEYTSRFLQEKCTRKKCLWIHRKTESVCFLTTRVLGKVYFES